MKFFHTADWHLGKLVQGVYMTEDQRHVLMQFIEAVEREQPDAVVVAGDLYDRAVPPTEAVDLLDEVLERIVVDLGVPVLAVSGNHDSPDRLNFATRIMEGRGLHLAGQFKKEIKSVALPDAFGEVHFHLVPYADPAQVRFVLEDETIRTHDDAMKAITERIRSGMRAGDRHVFVGHAFVTPHGEKKENTSESERPLSIGGADHVHAEYFAPFHYTALGHLHQAHFVMNETVRYSGSPLKYSISEENHDKGYYIIEMDAAGAVTIEKRHFRPLRDMRRIEGTIEEIEQQQLCDDYVFVTLTNESPVLFPMEKVRAVYPNALHVERRVPRQADGSFDAAAGRDGSRQKTDPAVLFSAFYGEVTGTELSEGKRRLFEQVYHEVMREEGEAG